MSLRAIGLFSVNYVLKTELTAPPRHRLLDEFGAWVSGSENNFISKFFILAFSLLHFSLTMLLQFTGVKTWFQLTEQFLVAVSCSTFIC